MPKPTQLVIKNLIGIEAAKALAEKLLEESAFFQVTPLPAGEYEFAVKVDRKSLLDDESEMGSRTYEDADFSTMDMDGLVAWYVKNVGYDPVEDDPLRIPRPSGHLFHKHPATDSTMIRPPIPRSSGHP